MHELVFLKLGGSLITDKTQRYSPRLHKLHALADEIQSALAAAPHLRLILGHGSGSFGHFAVQEHLLQESFEPGDNSDSEHGRQYWRSFAEVSYRAAELNRHVMEALHGAGLAAVGLPPSAMAMASAGAITQWDLAPVNAAVRSGLVPVIFGDIVFDDIRGGTVLSTEKLMMYLARRLGPSRILLAGLEDAVWADFPRRQVQIDRITPASYATISKQVGSSEGTDVTGGMRAKVQEMLALVQEIPDLTVHIFSGETDGNVRGALGHMPSGTTIARD